MKAIVNDKEIKCPICSNNDFDVIENVTIQAVYREDYSENLHIINKDELNCSECGWTGYFENGRDPKKDWKEKKIQYK